LVALAFVEEMAAEALAAVIVQAVQTRVPLEALEIAADPDDAVTVLEFTDIVPVCALLIAPKLEPATSVEELIVIFPDEPLFTATLLTPDPPPVIVQRLNEIVPVADPLATHMPGFPPPALIDPPEIEMFPVPLFAIAMVEAPVPANSVDAVTLIEAAPLFLTALAFVEDPPIKNSELIFSVSLEAVKSKHNVVPARISVVRFRTVFITKPPPPVVAPAAVFVAVVRVARARAWPVPDPTPLAWKIVPTAFEAAPGKVVVPEDVISYH
jgi:hypothetical protein